MYPQAEKYEYKHPSFELKHRERSIDYAKYKKDARFFVDETGAYNSQESEKKSISMLFAGDLLCLEKMISKHTTQKGGYDFSLCFEYVKPLLKSVDFTAGNLETAVSHTAPYRGEIITHEGPYYCNAPIEYLESVVDAGFDMLTTANNHMLDAGVQGMIETLENVRQMGRIQTGTFRGIEDKYVIVNVCGFRIGFTAVAVSYNQMEDNLTAEGRRVLLNTYDHIEAARIYHAMKNAGAEYTICFPHWGEEYTAKITDKQMSMAKALTCIGFDAVIGSHAHVIQRSDNINGKPVLFSLGNLISHLNIVGKNKGIEYTLLYHLKLTRDKVGIRPQIAFIPCKILKGYRGIPYTVLPLNRTLGLEESRIKELQGTVSGVRKLLIDEEAQLELDLPVTAQALEAYKESQSVLNERVGALVEENIRLSALIAKGKKRIEAEIKSGNGLHVDRLGVFKCHDDYAEMIRCTFDGAVIKLGADIQGKKLKILNNDNLGNDVTRLVYLPKYAVSIGASSFENFAQLESVRIYGSLKEIGEGAFRNCKKMTGLILPGSLEKIGDCAFAGCESLLSIKIPPKVKVIGQDAFKGCGKLTVYCEEGSYAERYARERGINVEYMPLTKEKKEMKIPKVTMGEMNGWNDKHPKPILAVCYALNKPLPQEAKCGEQPSKYIGETTFDGSLAEVKRLLHKRMPLIDEESLEKEYRNFKNKYRSQACLKFTGTDLTVYFGDYLLFARPRGFSHNDYFDFEFYRKEIHVRDTFISEEYRLHIYKLCAHSEYRDIFKNKHAFNERFKGFVNRDWVDTTVCSYEEFCSFVGKQKCFFGKPVGRTGGKGARVIDASNMDTRELYEMCKTEGLLCEEIIVQHDQLAAFNDSTLNTIRILTILDSKDEPQVLMAAGRFGRKGKVVDNFHGGGVAGIIDVDTGVVITEAIGRNHLRNEIHPDSGRTIIGFKYPEWEKVIDTVKRAALVVPQVRHVGWDVAITKNGEVEIVEGNSRSGCDMLQAPDQIGRRYLYESHIKALEKKTGIVLKPNKPLQIREADYRKAPLWGNRSPVALLKYMKVMVKKFVKRIR